MSKRPPIDLNTLLRRLHEQSLPARNRALMYNARRAAAASSRPDATAVHREPPPDEPVFDPDLWTPPNQPKPPAQLALGHDERPEAHLLLHLF